MLVAVEEEQTSMEKVKADISGGGRFAVVQLEV
jgi:hypothetical protein